MTSGGTAMTRSGPSATAAVVSARRPQATRADDLAQRLVQAALAGEGRPRGVHELDDPRVDVAAR